MTEPTLKNRPTARGKSGLVRAAVALDMEDWFEGFEKTVKEQIIRLGQLRAGNIGQIWDAGWAYGLLKLLGKAPEFKTREEAYKWAEEKICRFCTAKEAKKEVLGQ